MITSFNCWLGSTCNKLKKTNECQENDIFCIKLFKLNQLYELALITDSQRKHLNLRLDENKIDEHVFRKLKDIQENIEQFVLNGNNLYIYSSITGNGKTAWSLRLIQSYFNSIWYKSDIDCKGLFVNVPRYLLAIKDNISQFNEYAHNIKNRIYTADLVIWDDIGTKSATSFEHETLLSIIDTRMNNNKSNIFTSNITPDSLKSFAGDRLYSRIINYSDCLEFKGEDKRRLKF